MRMRILPILAIVLTVAVLRPTHAGAATAAEDQASPGAVLRLKVVSGDGAVHRAGSRSSVPLTVQVTDETGRPVEDATVVLLMPNEGPAGIFASGLSTEILRTGSEGRVSVFGIRWGSAAGLVPIRITAVKSGVRAGMISTQTLIQGEEGDTRSGTGSVSRPRGKWIAVALVAAGAAAGGLVLGLAGKQAATALAPAAAELPAVQVGLPTISIGAP